MTELLTRLACMPDSIEVRSVDDEHFIRGVAAPYNETIDLGDIVESFAPGVFRRSIDHRGSFVGLREEHSVDRFPVGTDPTFEETADGLLATFLVSPTNRGQEALKLASHGKVGMSVGFIPVQNQTSEVGGRRHVVRTEAKLDHIGLVLNPAYQKARILEARDETRPEFDPDNPLIAPRLARHRALLGMRGL